MSKETGMEYVGGPAALAALESTLLVIPEVSVGVFRASVPLAVTNALVVARSYSEDRPLFEATFKKAAFDPDEVADIEQRALALWQADVEYRLTVRPEQAIAEHLDDATALRKELVRAADYLWGNDPEMRAQLAGILQWRSYMDTANLLATMATVFESRWSEIEGRCDVTRDHISRARELGHKMLGALARGKQRDNVDAARDLRDRAAVHLQRGVQHVRSAAAFLFWRDPLRLEDYPSIYHGRKVSRRSRNDDRDADTATEDTGAGDAGAGSVSSAS